MSNESSLFFIGCGTSASQTILMKRSEVLSLCEGVSCFSSPSPFALPSNNRTVSHLTRSEISQTAPVCLATVRRFQIFRFVSERTPILIDETWLVDSTKDANILPEDPIDLADS